MLAMNTQIMRRFHGLVGRAKKVETTHPVDTYTALDETGKEAPTAPEEIRQYKTKFWSANPDAHLWIMRNF